MSVLTAPTSTALPRLLAGIDARGRGPVGLTGHEQIYGPDRRWESERLIAEIERSGLRGRGGADFPTARKLASVAGRRGASAVIVNGSETEPASRKDRTLLRALPHLVLDGAAHAADAVGAAEVIVVVGQRARGAREALEAALAERTDRVPVRLFDGSGGYVSGEESAVVHALERGVATPTATPPRVFERGYRGRPTLVQNAETLAQLALVARFGARWFRALGTDADPGTVLTTVAGAVGAPGVYEIPFGTPLADLLAAAGDGGDPSQAVLIGGYFGAWADIDTARSLWLCRESLRPAGHAIGAGVLFVLGESACGLHESARLIRHLAGQSAGQCGPCLHGLAAISDAFSSLADGRGGPQLLQRLERWCSQVDGRGACHHPGGVVRLARSALDVFGAELRGHGRSCRARAARLPGLASAPPPAGKRPR